MRPADAARLLFLGALWGFSFIFMRIAAPVLGAIATAEIRVTVAGLFLLAVVLLNRVPVHPKRLWSHYLVVGLLNSAIPFVFISWAETRLPASIAAILNATSPLFGMAVAAVWLGDRLSTPKMIGMAVAFAGVAGVVGGGLQGLTAQDLLPVGSSLFAALSYGVAATYAKAKSTDAKPIATAFGSQAASAVLLAPLLPFALPSQPPTSNALAAVVALGILCTGLAYILYFHLIADVGPAKALTVTFIAPLFGLLWSALFLNEAITPMKLAACGAILIGTGLATGVLSRDRS
jgi:drug/metabolite transporter (DMT)-like permease